MGTPRRKFQGVVMHARDRPARLTNGEGKFSLIFATCLALTDAGANGDFLGSRGKKADALRR